MYNQDQVMSPGCLDAIIFMCEKVFANHQFFFEKCANVANKKPAGCYELMNDDIS